MKNEKLKNAIVKATSQILETVNDAKNQLNHGNNISISEAKDIQFEVEFDEFGLENKGLLKFTITASKIPTNNLQTVVGII